MIFSNPNGTLNILIGSFHYSKHCLENKYLSASKCIDGVIEGFHKMCHSKKERAPWIALDYGKDRHGKKRKKIAQAHFYAPKISTKKCVNSSILKLATRQRNLLISPKKVKYCAGYSNFVCAQPKISTQG